MDWLHIIHAAASLIFVIGLIFLCLWLYKYLESKSKNNFFTKLNARQNIEIIETRRLDAKSSIMLIRCGKKRHTILLSPSGNILLETTSAETAKHD